MTTAILYITIKFNEKKLDFCMWRDYLFHIHFNLSWDFSLQECWEIRLVP